MTTFLLRGGAFLALSLALLFGLERLLAAVWFEDPRSKYATLFDSRADVRHLIIGPSTLAYGLNPAYLGGERPFYNFAMSGVNPVFTLAWYELFRRHHPAPEAVVLSADGFTFRGAMYRRIEHDAGFMPLPVAVEVALRPDSHMVESVLNNLTVLRDRQRLQNFLTGQRQPSELATEHHVRGFVPIRARAFAGTTYPETPYDAAKEAAFVTLLRRFQSERTQVVMVQAPLLKPGSAGDEADSARLRAIAQAHGVPFLNYNQEHRSALNHRQDAFFDSRHLNERGTRIFGPMLASDLKRLGWPAKRPVEPQGGAGL